MGKERVNMEFFAVQGKEKISFDNIVVVDQGKEKSAMEIVTVDQGKERSAMEIVTVDQGKEKSALDFVVA